MVEITVVSRVRFEKILMYSVLFIISTTILTTFPVAFADNIQDSIVEGTTITKLTTETFTTDYFVTGSSNTGSNDPDGCNITLGTNPLSVTIQVIPDGIVTVSPNPVIITDCKPPGNNSFPVTFSSEEGGTFQVTATYTDPDGYTYEINPNFTLIFIEPEHDVDIVFDPTQSPLPTGKFTVSGNLIDLDENNEGIPDQNIGLTVEGACGTPFDNGICNSPFPGATTGGVTLNGVTGDVVANGSYWTFPTGATISLPNSKVVTVQIMNVPLGSAANLKLCTDANNPASCSNWTINGVGENGVSDTRSSVSGFELIEVLGTTNISRITTKSGTDVTIHDIFPTGDTFGTKTFNAGRFESEGYAKSTPEENLGITGNYAGLTGFYKSDTSTTEYDIIQGATPLVDLTLGGFGGAESAIADRGTGRIMQTCATDTDGDGACDSQEGTCATCGIPFTIDVGAGPVTYYYKLPGSDPLTKQIWVEHDAVNYHKPLQTTLDGVKNVFTPRGLYLINTLSDTVATVPGGTTMAHPLNISIWGDATPNTVRTDDFNTIKSDWFGTAGEKVVLGGTRSITAPTSSVPNLIINPGGNDDNFKVPSAPPTAKTATVGAVTTEAGTGTGGKTQGFIIYTLKLTPTTSTSLTAGPVSMATNTYFYALPTATLSPYSAGIPYQILTVQVPFRTTGTVTTAQSVPQITIPIGPSNVIGSTFMTVLSPSPSYTTTLLDAKAYVYRYALWGHCPQSAACGSSGQAELNGNDMFISLGKGFGGTNPSGHTTSGYSIGTVGEQQGTFAHELGHTLNLLHGGTNQWISPAPAPLNIGNDNSQNCKPNYFSVMNYARQTNIYLTAASGALAWSLGYSDGTRPPLIETGLLENMDETPLISAVYGPALIESPTNNPANDYRIMTGTETYIDWDRDGVDDGGNVVTSNINNINIVGCNSSDLADATKPLRDYDDWNNLKLTFANAAGSFDGYSPFQSESNGRQRIEALLASTNYDVISPTSAHVNWGQASTFNIKFDIIDSSGNIFQVPGVTSDIWRDNYGSTCSSGRTQEVDIGADGGPLTTFCYVGSGVYSENDKTISFAYKFLKADKGKKIFFVVEAVNPFDSNSRELVRDIYPPSTADANTSFDVTINS